MDLDLTSTELSVSWRGDKFSLANPSVKQHVSYTKTLAKSKGREVECLIDFLADLGLPSDTSYEMELGHLQQIVEALTGAASKGK